MTQLLEPDTSDRAPSPPPEPAPAPPLAPPPAPGPGRQWGRWVLAAVIVLAAVLVGQRGMPSLDIMPKLRNPFASTVVDRSPAPLVLALRDLAEYRAATGTFQQIIDIERDTANLPSVISGERVTFLAVGSVDAVVDFSDLGQQRVRTDADRRSVTITLPAPRLSQAEIDYDASRVLDRDRGLIERLSGVFEETPTNDAEVYKLAEAKLNAAAGKSDLAGRAEQNTRAMLTTLARSLGYTDVRVSFER